MIDYTKDGKFYSRSMARIEFTLDQWTIILDEVSNLRDILKDLENVGGYAITHVGKLYRTDGSDFSSEEAIDFLTNFYHFTSFVRGFWCPSILWVGFDAIDRVTWEYWLGKRTTAWQSVISWFDRENPDSLGAVCKGFMKKWNDVTWKDTIQTGIYWYISSNIQSGGLEGSIVLSQSALELIAWITFVESGPNLYAVSYEKLTAADQFRLLIHYSKIPLNIPTELSEVINHSVSLPKNEQWIDGPHAITEMRNGIVHAKKRHRMRLSSSIKFEIWSLSLWYLELLLLHLFEFKGNYCKRIDLPILGSEVVPWEA